MMARLSADWPWPWIVERDIRGKHRAILYAENGNFLAQSTKRDSLAGAIAEVCATAAAAVIQAMSRNGQDENDNA